MHNTSLQQDQRTSSNIDSVVCRMLISDCCMCKLDLAIHPQRIDIRNLNRLKNNFHI